MLTSATLVSHFRSHVLYIVDQAIAFCHQCPAWAASFPVPSVLPHPGLHARATTLHSAGEWPSDRWTQGSTDWLAARLPPELTFLLLQRVGRFTVEHLELSHRRKPGQRPYQPHQLSGQLLHHWQHWLRPTAGCGSRDHEWSLFVR